MGGKQGRGEVGMDRKLLFFVNTFLHWAGLKRARQSKARRPLMMNLGAVRRGF